MSFLFSACLLGFSTLFCSFLTTLFDPSLLTRFCYLPNPVWFPFADLFFSDTLHWPWVWNVERNHEAKRLEAQIQESERTWNLALKIELFLSCKNAVKGPLPLTQHSPWNTLTWGTSPFILLLVLWPLQFINFSGPIYLYHQDNTTYSHR